MCSLHLATLACSLSSRTGVEKDSRPAPPPPRPAMPGMMPVNPDQRGSGSDLPGRPRVLWPPMERLAGLAGPRLPKGGGHGDRGHGPSKNSGRQCASPCSSGVRRFRQRLSPGLWPGPGKAVQASVSIHSEVSKQVHAACGERSMEICYAPRTLCRAAAAAAMHPGRALPATPSVIDTDLHKSGPLYSYPCFQLVKTRQRSSGSSRSTPRYPPRGGCV